MSWLYTLTGKPFTSEDREHKANMAFMGKFRAKWDPIVQCIIHEDSEKVARLVCPVCGGSLQVYIGETEGLIGRRLIAKCEACDQCQSMNIGNHLPHCVEDLGYEFSTGLGYGT